MKTKKKSSKNKTYDGHINYRIDEMRQDLMIRVANTIRENELTQIKAANLLGISQPRVSNLMRGQIEKFSIEMLIKWLFLLGKDVAINVGKNLHQRVPDPELIQEKIDYYSRAIAVDPENRHALMSRGNIYFDQKNYDMAMADFARLRQTEPDHPGPLNNIALILHRTNRLDEALIASNELIKNFPDYSGGYSQRGITYLKLGHYKKAIKDFTKETAIDPDAISPFMNRATAYEELKEYKKAKQDYRQAMAREVNKDYYLDKIAELDKKIKASKKRKSSS